MAGDPIARPIFVLIFSVMNAGAFGTTVVPKEGVFIFNPCNILIIWFVYPLTYVLCLPLKKHKFDSL
jgi:hypothetical protein